MGAVPGSLLPHTDINQWKHTMYSNLILIFRAASKPNNGTYNQLWISFSVFIYMLISILYDVLL